MANGAGVCLGAQCTEALYVYPARTHAIQVDAAAGQAYPGNVVVGGDLVGVGHQAVVAKQCTAPNTHYTCVASDSRLVHLLCARRTAV